MADKMAPMWRIMEGVLLGTGEAGVTRRPVLWVGRWWTLSPGPQPTSTSGLDQNGRSGHHLPNGPTLLDNGALIDSLEMFKEVCCVHVIRTVDCRLR